MGDSANTPSQGWDDVLGNGKLLKRTLMAGHGNRPKMGNFVHVRYGVYPFTDSESDYTAVIRSKPPFEKEDKFYLGERDAGLHALELGVALMNLGEKAVIKCINPLLAYEAEPPEYRPDGIPPSSNLFISVELLSDDGPPIPWIEHPLSEQIAFASKKVDRGNAYCRAGIFSSAINAYSAALRTLGQPENDEEDEEQDSAADEIRMKAFSGLSAAHFNSSSFENALKGCDEALKLKPDLMKVVFRRGRCLAQLGRLQEAKVVMTAARKMAMENQSAVTEDFMQFINSELARVRSLLLADTHREAELYRKMIDVKPLPPKKSIFQVITRKRAAVVIILIVSLCLSIWIGLNFVLND